MQIRFEFQCSYQDMVAYEVIGHANIFSVETYRNTPHGLEYMCSTFNHCGDPTSFQRNILSRQGGAVVHSHKDHQARWTPEFYAEFVLRLRAKYVAAKKRWAETCERRGWGEEELRQFEEMRAVPKAMYWSQEASTYLAEPWWTPNHACDYCINISKMTGVLNCPIHVAVTAPAAVAAQLSIGAPQPNQPDQPMPKGGCRGSSSLSNTELPAVLEKLARVPAGTMHQLCSLKAVKVCTRS